MDSRLGRHSAGREADLTRSALAQLLRAFSGILAIVLPASGVAAQELAVVGAHLVMGEAGGRVAPVTIVISDGRIESIDSGSTVLDSTVSRIDAAGLFVVPGRSESLGFTSESSDLAWREEMLVRLSAGVTELVAPGPVIATATSQLTPNYPAVRFVPESRRSGSRGARPELEVGAEASFLILEEDPRVDSTTPTRPVAVVVGGAVYTKERLALEARLLAEERREVLYADMPFTNFVRRGAPFPVECVAESDDRCLGPDPGCALMHALLLVANQGIDCRAPLAGELRDRFLTSLARLATVAPADDWIVGQRVNFALIQRDFDHALEAVESCAAEAWWCDALRGLVLHTRAPGSAGAAFDAALASVPRDAPAWRDPAFPDAGDRGAFCEWRDVAYLIEEPSVRESYTTLPCGERSAFEARFWWLVDPLWSESGNPRRDEHVARNIRAKFRDQDLRIYGGVGRWHHAHCDGSLAGWGRDSSPSGEVRCRSSHADWLRFGPPDSWRGLEHVRGPGFVIGANGKLVIHNGESCQVEAKRRLCARSTYGQLREGFLAGGYSFVPVGFALVAPERSTRDDWEVALGEGHERMETAETWYNLDQQTAVLRRGDSLAVLSAGAFPTLLPSLDGVDAVLALGHVPDREVLFRAADVDRVTGVLRVEATIEDSGWVVSLEASAPGIRGRSRQGATAPVLLDGFGISKPVLVAGDFDPATDDLLEAMIPSNLVPQADAAGLYVEIYGVESGDQVGMTLSYDVIEQRRSLLGRIGAALGIGGGPSGPVTVEWTEHVEDVRDGVGSVFVAAAFGDIPTGEFDLSISAVQGDRSTSTNTTYRSR